MDKHAKYFMHIARTVAQLSNDWHTKVGAVFVKNDTVLSTGYNASPYNFDESLIPTQNGNTLIDQKNTYMVHAELNALLNYTGCITDLQDSTVYVTICPCSQCAKMLAQLKVRKVIYLEDYHRIEETNAAKYIFKVCKIECQKFDEGDNK